MRILCVPATQLRPLVRRIGNFVTSPRSECTRVGLASRQRRPDFSAAFQRREPTIASIATRQRRQRIALILPSLTRLDRTLGMRVPALKRRARPLASLTRRQSDTRTFRPWTGCKNCRYVSLVACNNCFASASDSKKRHFRECENAVPRGCAPLRTLHAKPRSGETLLAQCVSAGLEHPLLQP
jgi:hypothetical protein